MQKLKDNGWLDVMTTDGKMLVQVNNITHISKQKCGCVCIHLSSGKLITIDSQMKDVTDMLKDTYND